MGRWSIHGFGHHHQNSEDDTASRPMGAAARSFPNPRWRREGGADDDSRTGSGDGDDNVGGRTIGGGGEGTASPAGRGGGGVGMGGGREGGGLPSEKLGKRPKKSRWGRAGTGWCGAWCVRRWGLARVQKYDSMPRVCPG
jgi:hypothetical protein